MEKTTLTFYLPKAFFAKMKIAAVKMGLSFSDLVIRCTLAMIHNNTFDQLEPKPQFDQSTMVYLTPDEKKTIKMATANYSASISEFVYQALSEHANRKQQLPERDKIDIRRRPRKQDTGDKPKKLRFSYNLTLENNYKLMQLSADTGMTRKQVIIDSVKKLNKGLRSIERMPPKSERSSMLLTRDEMKLLSNKADEFNINVIDLINRSIERY